MKRLESKADRLKKAEKRVIRDAMRWWRGKLWHTDLAMACRKLQETRRGK